jgi:hypothetical protein
MDSGAVDDTVDTYIVKMTDFTGKISESDEFSPQLYTSEDPVYIAAKAKLTGGKLEASYVNGESEWYFLPHHGDKPGWSHLAEEVCFHFPISDPLVLRFRRLGTQTWTSMSIAANPTSHWAEVRIGNLPDEDIIPDMPSDEEMPADEHFNLYYDMAKRPPRDRAIPNSRTAHASGMPQETHLHELNAEQGTEMQVAEQAAFTRWLKARRRLDSAGVSPSSAVSRHTLQDLDRISSENAMSHRHGTAAREDDSDNAGAGGPNCPPVRFKQY